MRLPTGTKTSQFRISRCNHPTSELRVVPNIDEAVGILNLTHSKEFNILNTVADEAKIMNEFT
jgi:hypothetical protein